MGRQSAASRRSFKGRHYQEIIQQVLEISRGKDRIFLRNLVLVAAAAPWGVWLFKWWTDPRNAPPGLKRWVIEAMKEEVC